MNTVKNTIKIYAEKSIILIANTPNCFKNDIVKNINNKILSDRSIAEILCNNETQTYLFTCENPKETLNYLKKSCNYLQAAGGIVMNQLSEYLLIYRRDLWDLPKGKVEDKENLQQAAIREVQEETGIKASNVLNFVTNTWHCYLCDDKITLKETYWYLMYADKQQQTIPQKEENITQVLWASKAETKKLIETKSFPLIVDLMMPYLNN